MASTPKAVRKNIKSTELTIKKGTIFPKQKMKKIAKDTAESMKKSHKRKSK